MDTATVRVSVTGHLRFGWAVQRFVDGGVGPALLTGSVVGKVVVFTWDGKNAAGAVVPDGAYRITVWTADASNNRASVTKVVTVDRRAAGGIESELQRWLSGDAVLFWDLGGGRNAVFRRHRLHRTHGAQRVRRDADR